MLSVKVSYCDLCGRVIYDNECYICHKGNITTHEESARNALIRLLSGKIPDSRFIDAIPFEMVLKEIIPKLPTVLVEIKLKESGRPLSTPSEMKLEIQLTGSYTLTIRWVF